MKLIVAVNNKGYIGKDGTLMWKCREDLRHFKQLTDGGWIIVGRTTYEKCLGGKPLPNRHFAVVGSDWLTLPVATRVAITGAFMDNKDVWVIGGATIYNQLLPLCEEVHISHIDDDQEGDTTFELPSDYRGQVLHYYFKPDSHGTNTEEVKSIEGDAVAK